VRKLRVLILVDAFPRRSESFIANKAMHLAERGHEVHVLAYEPPEYELDADTLARAAGRLTVERLPLDEVSSRRLPQIVLTLVTAFRRDPRFMRTLFAILRSRHGTTRSMLARLHRLSAFAGQPADILHVEFAHIAARHVEVLQAMDCPTLVSCRGADIRLVPLVDLKLPDALRRMFAVVDRAVCVSRDIATMAMGYGLEPAKVYVQSPGVDVEFFAPRSAGAPRVPDGTVRLVSTGRPIWLKGHEYALKAVRILLDRGHRVTFTIVGTAVPASQATGELLYAIRELELTHTAALAPPCDRHGVRSALAAADVFVLPSLNEGINNATLEAMATGLPVVVTDVGGMREAVRDGVDGLVVPPRDSVALANAIERLIEDPGLRDAMGREGARHVRESFDIQRQIDGIEALYDELVRGG
jgi:glycosyltransferase involved in cell wall biosynthesis